jgi:hypothetical protein
MKSVLRFLPLPADSQLVLSELNRPHGDGYMLDFRAEKKKARVESRVVV